MSRLDKAKDRLRDKPKGYKWNEAKALLAALGFHPLEGSGSRVKFVHPDDGSVVSLHKPHPGNELKLYAVKDLHDYLEGRGML